ncbi:MAG: PHP domain-containing protein [Pseudonocardiaceae bacterium]
MRDDSARCPRSAVSWPRAVADALAAPEGARWHRVALQVNPYGYRGAPPLSTDFPDEQSYNEAIVHTFRELDIELIAITDHWRVDTTEGLAQAAEAAGVVVLPGFEAVSSAGVHLLVLFERGTSYDEVGAAIGACGGTPGCAADAQGQAPARVQHTQRQHPGAG